MPQAQVQELPLKRRGAKQVARKDKDGQEQIIQLDELRSRIDHLVQLRTAAKTAADEYAEAVKFAAERSGLNSGTVRKFIAARCGDDFEGAARKAEQIALVFEEVGGA